MARGGVRITHAFALFPLRGKYAAVSDFFECSFELLRNLSHKIRKWGQAPTPSFFFFFFLSLFDFKRALAVYFQPSVDSSHPRDVGC